MLTWIIGATLKHRKKSKRSRHSENEKKPYDDLTDDDIEVLEDDLIYRVKMKNKEKQKFRNARYEVLQVCFF